MENFKNIIKNETLQKFQGEGVKFLESSKVKAGVVCDVYEFSNNKEKDLGIIRVKARHKTPLQKVLKGDKTIEIFIKGKGVLRVGKTKDDMIEYVYPETKTREIVVEVGQFMQWEAGEDNLTFAEICYPPYENGRFENIKED